MTNTSTDVGTLFVIIMGSLIGIGTVAMGITSYSINKQLDNVTGNFSKKDNNNDIDDRVDKEEEKKDIMDYILNLKKDLSNKSKYQGFNTNRDEYSLTPESGWKIKEGGKRSKKSKKKSKRKTSKK